MFIIFNSNFNAIISLTVRIKHEKYFFINFFIIFIFRYGQTALMEAAFIGHEHVVIALLRRGAKVNAKNKESDQAIQLKILIT